MTRYHAVCILSGDRKKTLPNFHEEQEVLESVIIPFRRDGIVTAKWGSGIKSYQVIDMKVYKTEEAWDKRSGPLDDLIQGKTNLASRLFKKADSIIEAKQATHRVFIVMPIQGEKYGSMNDQRIHKEFNDRFLAIEKSLNKMKCVAIRIDKEYSVERSLAQHIIDEIEKAKFIIADLTDERPSCYYELGYADALKKTIICIASKESIVKPGTITKIHFDVHRNVNLFTNHQEMVEKIESSVKKHLKKILQ